MIDVHFAVPPGRGVRCALVLAADDARDLSLESSCVCSQIAIEGVRRLLDYNGGPEAVEAVELKREAEAPIGWTLRAVAATNQMSEGVDPTKERNWAALGGEFVMLCLTERRDDRRRNSPWLMPNARIALLGAG